MQAVRTNRLRRRILLLAAGAALVVAGCSGDTSGKLGQELYEQTCAVCHGVTGAGTPGRPSIGAGSNAVQLTDEQIRGVMDVGPGAMPSFSRLTAEQLDSLVEYVRTLQAGQLTD